MHEWHMRLLGLVGKLRPWRDVTRTIRDFHDLDGINRILAFPGVVSSLLTTIIDPYENGVWRHLRNSGWAPPPGHKILRDWVYNELQNGGGEPIEIHNDPDIIVTLYKEMDIVVKQITREHRIELMVAPGSDRFFNWVTLRIDKMVGVGGQLIRFIPPYLDDSYASMEMPSPHDEKKVWDVEISPTSNSRIIEGSWAPSVKTVETALANGRTLLLFGPPGAGKTEMAIRASGGGRVVLIPGTAFGRQITGREAAEVATLFRADVLVVDDMRPSATVGMLEEFEVLSRRKISVVATVMTDGTLPHLQGLRPGRVDEMFEFKLPDADGRRALLQYFAPDICWDAVVGHELCEGMTPAYLRELARRVSIHGDWLAALESLALQRKIAA